MCISAHNLLCSDLLTGNFEATFDPLPNIRLNRVLKCDFAKYLVLEYCNFGCYLGSSQYLWPGWGLNRKYSIPLKIFTPAFALVKFSLPYRRKTAAQGYICA